MNGAEPVSLLSGSTEGGAAAAHGGGSEPQRWSLSELERLVRERPSGRPARDELREALLVHLREYAAADGMLPGDFDGLVREYFAELVETAAPAPAGKPAAPVRSRPKRRLAVTKKVLVLAILVGLIAYVAGGSTFASFSAETTNPGNSIASGTLTLSDQVNSGTVCNSYGAGSNDNDNAACSAALTLTNLAPGVTGGQAKLTIANTGSIDASLFSVFAPYVNATLNQTLSSGATIGTGQSVTSFTVTPLEGPVGSGDAIVLAYGGVTQQFCAGASAAAGATSIAISGGYPAGTTGVCPAATTTAGTSFAVGTRVNDTSSDTSAANTDCYDQKTTTPGVAGATKGTDLGFNPTANNPLCSGALLYIQEQSTVGSSTYDYCWFGRGSPYGDQSPQVEDSNGQCRTPTTMTLASNAASGQTTYSLNVGTLGGNIRSGDTITLSENGTTTTCTAAATYYIGATGTISVNGCTTSGSATTFDSSAAVKDTSAFAALNGTNPSSTISSFDTAHNSSARITMAPLTGNGTANSGSSIQLAKKGGTAGVGDTRVFYVGVYVPSGSGQNQNGLQGLMSTFGLTWHIDQ